LKFDFPPVGPPAFGRSSFFKPDDGAVGGIPLGHHFVSPAKQVTANTGKKTAHSQRDSASDQAAFDWHMLAHNPEIAGKGSVGRLQFAGFLK
jgi:hypothetical protein